ILYLCALDIKVHFTDIVQTLQIYNVYNPPPISTQDTTGPSILPVLYKDLQESPHKHTMVLGDFNLHHPLWGGCTMLSQHAYANKLIDIVEEHNLTQLTPLETITWSAKGSESTIDLTYASEFIAYITLKYVVQHDLDQHSDYYPIATTLQLQVAKQEITKQRAWKKLDSNKLIQSLRDSKVFNTNQKLRTKEDLDQKVAQMHTAYLQAIDIAVPWSYPSQFAEPFWTPECTEVVYYTQQLRNTQPGSQEYRNAVQSKRKIVRTAKTLFFCTKIHEATEDTKGIWRLAKWACTKGYMPTLVPQFPDLTTPQGLATTFQARTQALKQRFFPIPPDPNLLDIEGYNYPEPFVQDQITIDDVRQAIKASCLLKALGITGIPHLVIQKLLEVTALVLTTLFQACID